MLTTTIGEWTALVGVALSLLTVIVFPVMKYLNKKRKEYNQTVNGLLDVTQGLNNASEAVREMSKEVAEVKTSINDLSNDLQDLREKTSIFETQQLKYMINDALFGYDCIEDIPDEVLLNASQCCVIYIGKGLNHETGAKCKLIYKELERRQAEKIRHKTEGENHE